MSLRHYQLEAVTATFGAWGDHRAVLGVAATGLGKTVILAEIIRRTAKRAMVIAHREELIFQAKDKVGHWSGRHVDVEMAELYAGERSLHGKARVVVSSVQTQTSRRERFKRFDPREFDILVIDEAHHATSESYRRVIDHYRTNTDLSVLGVTATPDRADDQKLGQVFSARAFNYDMRWGIDEGYLVPVSAHLIDATDIDLSKVKDAAGDLSREEVAEIMEEEGPVHKVVRPTLELAGDRRTLVFGASVQHAKGITEILNRSKPRCAHMVHAKTPKEQRRHILTEYAEGRFQYLVNYGVFTEGFDDPGIEVIVMARPTKVRSLYQQMLGRGTRPFPPGCIDQPDMYGSASMRRRAVADSAKPRLEVIDFAFNAGRHSLVSTFDVLGANFDEGVVRRARETSLRRQGPVDVIAAVERAAHQSRADRDKKEQLDRERRKGLLPDVLFRKRTVNPFEVLGVVEWQTSIWDQNKPLTEPMRKLLKSQRVDTTGMTFRQAQQVCSEIARRFKENLCRFPQAEILAKRGLDTEVSPELASELIDEIARREGWKNGNRVAPNSAPAPPRAQAAGRY